MKKVVVLSIFFITSLYGMKEHNGEEEVLIESKVNLSDPRYQKLVYHIAEFVVLSKVNQEREIKKYDCSLCGVNFDDYITDRRVADDLIDFVQYRDFLTNYGSYTSKIKNALRRESSLDVALNAYCEKTEKKAVCYKTFEVPESFKDDICIMLTKEQKKFFKKHIEHQLNSLEKLWRSSRVTVLEALWEIQKKDSLAESCVRLCDKGWSYSSGVCSGAGLGFCIVAQSWLPGSLLCLLGMSTCLVQHAYDVKPSICIDNRKYEDEQKIKKAVRRILMNDNSLEQHAAKQEETEE